VWALKEKCISL